MTAMQYLTTSEVATHWGVSVSTVLRWIKSGNLKAVDIGRGKVPNYRILASDINTVARNCNQSRMPEGVEELV